MSLPGTNAWVDIARYETGDDNAIGGAMVTGSWIHENVAMHIEAMKPVAMLMQTPGAQIIKTYIATVRYDHVRDAREGDRVMVKKPYHSPYIDQWLVITSFDPSAQSTRSGYANVRMYLQKMGHAEHELDIA